jgi:16S rRNA (guanine(966)-N(2))-methyltransferase RsmD
MRIIGGDLRGKQINPPANFMARPTTDFAKEGLFNILENMYDISALSFLDLFSGTGSISYEFASRGCSNITAVEMNNLHASFIKSTVAKLNLTGMSVVRHNVFDFLNICRMKYDIIFADPPYDIDGLATIPDKVISRSLLNADGIFILEHPASLNFGKHPNIFKERKYGNVHFSFFKQ